MVLDFGLGFVGKECELLGVHPEDGKHPGRRAAVVADLLGVLVEQSGIEFEIVLVFGLYGFLDIGCV